MKKRKCGFRQKLGIVLAAGMIISNMNFAVLPVSATEDSSPGSEASVDPDVKTVVDEISCLPALENIKSLAAEDLAAIGIQVNDISDKIDDLNRNHKELPEDAAETFEGIKNYFVALSKQRTPSTEENGAPKELSAEKSASAISTITDYLAGELKKIADGSLTDTRIDVSHLIYTGYSAAEVKALVEEISAKRDEILQSLLINHQNDLFWFDKSYKDASGNSQAFSFSAEYTGDSTAVTGSAVFSFVVSPEYRQSPSDLYTVDSTQINSANTALAKAQEIVNANAGKSDYEKLLAYKNAICELVSYDDNAAGSNYSGSKAPWTMVSVFDGDPNTNVVCEGYAKAFQYLCDLSSFKSAKCYTVSGKMAGGTGAGDHMWNIVSIGSNNYLVDVTNCDEGAVGAPDKLFMAIPSGGAWDGTYIFSSAYNVSYAYDSDQIGYYGESILKLATTPYDPTKDPAGDDTNKPGTDKPNKPSKPSSKPGSSSSGNDSTGTGSDNQAENNTDTPAVIWTVETSPSDQNTYRLEVRSTIEVPAELAGNDTLNTPEKIESQIRSSLTAKGISNDNIRVYDVALQVYVNGAWQDVNVENFPSEGVTVTVPYPSGTDSTYNFVASHLFTKSMNGYPAGHIETFPESGAIRTTTAGISFTVHGLSPISVGWSKAAGNTSTNVSPKTGDNSPLLLYMVLMLLAAAVTGTVYVKQIRVRKK